MRSSFAVCSLRANALIEVIAGANVNFGVDKKNNATLVLNGRHFLTTTTRSATFVPVGPVTIKLRPSFLKNV